MITPLMEKAYEIDKGERIKKELLECDETLKKHRLEDARYVKEIGYVQEQPVKLGWSPPKRKKEPFIRLLSYILP